MNNKIVISIVIIFLLLFAGIFTAYLVDNEGTVNENDLKFLGITPENRTGLTISSEGPQDMDDVIRNIETKPYFEGYDNDTLNWMKFLNQREVFLSDDCYVIMNKYDASKINTVYITDAYIEEYIDCVVVENRSLGGNSSKNLLLVRDVENLGNQTYYLQGGA